MCCHDIMMSCVVSNLFLLYALLNMKKALLNAITTHLKTTKDFDKFFQDLLTPNEYKDLVERFAICTELSNGKSVREVAEKLNVAPARVVRGNRILKYDGQIVEKMI